MLGQTKYAIIQDAEFLRGYSASVSEMISAIDTITAI